MIVVMAQWDHRHHIQAEARTSVSNHILLHDSRGKGRMTSSSLSTRQTPTSRITFAFVCLFVAWITCSSITVQPVLAEDASSVCREYPQFAAGLFENVPWSCSTLFDCFLDYCLCVGGTLSTSCAPYSITDSASIGRCLQSRAKCIVAAAISSPWSSNISCRTWSSQLLTYYSVAYTNATNQTSSAQPTTYGTNFTDGCVVDSCNVVAKGLVNQNNAAAIVASVQYRNTSVCLIAPGGNQWPALLPSGTVPGCVATGSNRTYFTQVPTVVCRGIAACFATYCSCMGMEWDTTAAVCRTTRAITDATVAAAKSCASTLMSCVLNSALSTYVPGASSLDPDRCISWSVPIAEDYATYYYNSAAAGRSATALWKACNRSACELLTDSIGIENLKARATILDDACSFSGVSARPTFQPYNPCPFTCPDRACAGSLAQCACTGNASIRDPNVVFENALQNRSSDDSDDGGSNDNASYELSVDVTTAFRVTAYATYGATSINCSAYDYSPTLSFQWNVSSSVAGITNASFASSTSSTLSLPMGAFVYGGQYILTLTFSGLLKNQTLTMQWQFSGWAPSPVVSIANLGSELRVPNARPITIQAVISDALPNPLQAAYQWSCTVISTTQGGCPTLNNVTRTTLIIPAGVPPGEVRITYSYRNGLANSSIAITFVAGNLPSVRLVFTGTSVASGPDGVVVLSNQFVLFSASVIYNASEPLTYSWSYGQTSSSGNNDGSSSDSSSSSSNSTTIDHAVTSSLQNFPASSLSRASLASVANSAPNHVNWIRVRVTSTNDTSIYGEATAGVVVVEPLVFSSFVVQRAGSTTSSGTPNTTAVGLIDRIVMTPSIHPVSDPTQSITASTRGPYGTAFSFRFTYYDRLGTTSARVGLTVVPVVVSDGSNRVAYVTTAPLYSDPTLSSQVVTCSVSLSVGGNLVAASYNSTIIISRPTDMSAVVADTVPKAASVTDPVSAVALGSVLRTLIAQSSDAQEVSSLSATAIALVARVVKPQDASAMTAEDRMSLLGTISRALSASPADLVSNSQVVAAVVTAAVQGTGSGDDSLISTFATVVVDVVGSMDPKSSIVVASVFASAMCNDRSLPVGQDRVLETSGSASAGTTSVTVFATKRLVGDVRSTTSTYSFGSTTNDGSSTTAPTFTIPPMLSGDSSSPWSGLTDELVIGVAATVYANTNPYNTVTPSSPIVTVNIVATSTTGTSTIAVHNLDASEAIVIALPNIVAESVRCAYFDVGTGVWSATGVTTTRTSNSVASCQTTHLTAFGAFASASHAGPSAMLALMVALVVVFL